MTILQLLLEAEWSSTGYAKVTYKGTVYFFDDYGRYSSSNKEPTLYFEFASTLSEGYVLLKRKLPPEYYSIFLLKFLGEK